MADRHPHGIAPVAFPGFAATLAAMTLLSAGCGPTQADLTAREDRIRQLEGALEAASRRHEAARERIAELEEQLGQLSQVVRGLSGDVDALETDRSAARARLRDAEEALGRLDAEREALMGERESLEGERDLLSSRIERSEEHSRAMLADLEQTRRALEELRARERQARARADTFRDLLRRFRTLIEAGRLRVRVAHNRMVVELPASVLFDSGRAALGASGREVLEEVARVLAEVPNRDFQVAGHTDDQPIRASGFRSNWELSSSRALSVLHFLIERGLPPERLSAAGHADTQPVEGNDTAEGRQRNRRIDIVLVPNLEELPDLSSLEDGEGR